MNVTIFDQRVSCKQAFARILSAEYGDKTIRNHFRDRDALYVLFEGAGGRWISIFRYQSPSEQDMEDGIAEWSCLEMVESDNPYSFISCPLDMLKRSTCVDPLAIKWRRRCRDQMRKQKMQDEVRVNAREGDVLRISTTGHFEINVVFLRDLNGQECMAADLKGNERRVAYSTIVAARYKTAA